LQLTDREGGTVELWRLQQAYHRLIARYTLPCRTNGTVSAVLSEYRKAGVVVKWEAAGIVWITVEDRDALVQAIRTASTAMMELAA
jgi:hypothetical protein